VAGTPSYRPRVVDEELDALLDGLPAIAVEGAKGVGKTATASRRAATVVALDDPDRYAVARANPGRLLRQPTPVLFDEWQRLPRLWDLVRRAVDHGAPPASFLLTGSASPPGLGTHSGAGRIVRLRMRPLALAERDLGITPTVSLARLLRGRRTSIKGESGMAIEEYTTEVVTSGLPGLRGLGWRPVRAQLDGYVARIVDRDFPELGHNVRNPAALRRWMTAYAAASSTTASFETIRDASTAGDADKPAKTTVAPYRDVLERLWILDPVPAWQPLRHDLRRLAFPPKHQMADPALAARLIGADGDALLSALFESLVTLSVRVYAQAADAQVFHLRTKGGEHEVDLIVARADGRVVAIEVKLAAAVEDSDVKHLLWLRDAIGDDLLDMVIVTTGVEAYRRRDGVAVVPAALLGP
jgi:predicted AAA+ superfamily ATPase